MNKELLNLHYTAGLIDGEGTITLTIRKTKTGNKDFRLPVISVTSTTYELMEFLSQNYTGTISSRKQYKSNHKKSYSWKLVGSRAVTFCEKIHQFLKEPEKSRRAKLIAMEYNIVTPRNGKYNPKLMEAKLNFQKNFFHPSTP